MSRGWRTKADVLKDLGEVNGRRTGAEHLDRHVVAGERPPPIHHEAPDAEEMSYFFGGSSAAGASAAGDYAGPDLNGISVMLKLVNDMDETEDGNEHTTLYRNKMTDEIRISKLNPSAGEYVPPGSTKDYTRKVPNCNSPKKRSMSRGENNRTSTTRSSDVSNSTGSIPNGAEGSVMLKYNNMFKSKSDEVTPNRSVNKNKETPVSEKKTPNTTDHNAHPKPETSQKEPVNSLIKPTTLMNGLPKRKIEKSEDTDDGCYMKNTNEIKEIQEKIKSTIIASSTDNSLHTKRQKNVAIATLLKMGLAPNVEPVKLIKPEYFENPPSKDEDIEKKLVKDEEVPSKSSSETIASADYIDQDSISKVNGWFTNMENPKPKLLLQEPLTLKENASSITFKKKTNSSETSRNSDVSKENKKEPAKVREVKAFIPSSYASELLKRYEDNAQRAMTLTEDLGTRLERQLKERDEVIRQKLARQNAG